MSKESFFNKDNAFTKTIAKKMAAVALISSLTLGNAGCNQKAIEVVNDPTTPITDVNKEPTTPTTPNTPSTPDTKPTPTTPETPVETKTPRQIELEALLVKAPEVAGLTKAIEGDKIVYNNENKEKAGYYVEKAYYNGQETDGVSLSTDVIKQLIDQKKEEGPNTSFSLPVDPSEGQVVKVEFQQEMIKSGQIFKNGYFIISSETPVNLINSFSDNQKIRRVNSSIDKGKTIDESCDVVLSNNDTISGTLSFTLANSKFINPVFPTSQPYSSFSGELLGQMQGVLIFERISTSWEDLNKYFAYESNLLKINNSLVFTMETRSK
jgi:hypothetical protein